MKKALFVIDMQNDFIDGKLRNEEAIKIVPNVVEFISNWNDEDLIIATLDTHFMDYLSTQEGQRLPVEHCILGSQGHEINSDVKEALTKKSHVKYVTKETFGYLHWDEFVANNLIGALDEIVILGLCTDICVISNATILKATFPNVPMKVISSCCAGVTPESHKIALDAMKMIQIDIEE